MQDPGADPDPSHLPAAYNQLLRHIDPYYRRIDKALYIFIDALSFTVCLCESPGPRRGDVFTAAVYQLYSPPRIQDGVCG